MKLLLPIILTASLFAQDKNNQNSYSIYTNAKYYHNVILHQVKSSDLIAQNQSSTKKYTIPISSINKIKIKETGSTNLGKVFCVSLFASFSPSGIWNALDTCQIFFDCLFIALTNLSTALILGATSILLMFISRVRISHLSLLILFILISGGIALLTGQRGYTAISRVEDFINKKNLPYQLEQAYIAVSTGGLFGKGPGNSNQKNFLPQSSSDFIYAIIVEEYGFIMGISVLLLYLILLYRGLKIFINSDRPFGGLLSAGLSFALVIQAITNMCVVVGLLPVTGVTLPLVSMGGTSQLFTGITIGIILSISRENNKEISYA